MEENKIELETTKESYTHDEVLKLIQSEGDKVRTKYTQQLTELKNLIPPKQDEKEIELNNRVKELEEKEKVLNFKTQLTDKGLDVNLAQYLKNDSNLDEFIASLSKNNSYVPSGHKSQETQMTKKDFAKMPYLEKLKLYETNSVLYNKLSK